MLDIILDFETHYEGTYSLKHLPAARYIRDPRFQVLGAALALPGKSARYLTGETLTRALQAIPWDRVRLVAHNAAFDAAILYMHYGRRPAALACTMLQARYLIANGILDARLSTSLDALAPLVGMAKGDLEEATAAGRLDEYAALDAEICRALHEAHASRIPAPELDYMEMHIRMAAEPVLELDLTRLSKIANSEKSLETLFPIVRKDDTFAAALAALGVTPVFKTTNKGTYKLATAKTDGWLASLDNHENPKVRLLASVRRKASSTIERSRAQRFLDVGSPLPVPLLYYAAHTGRSGGCLVADTEVLVFDSARGVCNKRIVDVLPEDLVWDGIEFVPHDGVKFSGYAEVIEWDGVKGTPDHVVFTDAGEVSLREARAGGHNIQVAGRPTEDQVDAARRRPRRHKKPGAL